jgi:hypothetical protein
MARRPREGTLRRAPPKLTADSRRTAGLLVLTDVEPPSGSECFDTVLAADAAGWRVCLWAANASRGGDGARAVLQQHGIEVLYPPYTTSLSATLRSAPPGRFQAVLLWNRPDADELRARLAAWAPELRILTAPVFAIDHAERVTTWRGLMANVAAPSLR